MVWCGEEGALLRVVLSQKPSCMAVLQLRQRVCINNRDIALMVHPGLIIISAEA